MNKEDQKSFYLKVGNSLTDARRRRNMGIATLAKQSGEQYKTIESIESGEERCSLHHAVWMWNVLGLDITKIITEGHSGEDISGIDDII